MVSLNAIKMKGRSALLLVGIAVLGWSIGALFSTWRSNSLSARSSESTEDVEIRAQERLERFIRGIEVGQPFPDMAVWTPDGRRALRMTEVLSGGCVAVILSVGCESCVDDVVALQAVLDALGNRALPVVLLADRATGGGELSRTLLERGVLLPVYCDVAQLLRDQYQIITRTAYFRIDSLGVLREMKAWKEDPGDLAEFLTMDFSGGDGR